ncbi:MAG: hypothetical protein GXO13_04255 [Epsilonproteobacteria bacterium]|nr:hypothetical protein [Campylobacterota bacterium]
MDKFLRRGVEEGIITLEQAQKLEELKKRERFTLSSLLIWGGGILAVVSVTIFAGWGFFKYGYWVSTLGSLVLMGLFSFFTFKIDHPKARGVLGLIVVALTPLFLFSLLKSLGFWEELHSYRNYYRLINFRYLILELGTIGMALLYYRRLRAPILLFPIAFSLWFMSMDITGLFTNLSWEDKKIISLIFGFYTLLIGVKFEKREKGSGFWLFLFGVALFWGALTSLLSTKGAEGALYLGINLLLLLAGIGLESGIFLFFGGLGTLLYFSHFAHLFQNFFISSFLFAGAGLGLILLGVRWEKRGLPTPFRKIRPLLVEIGSTPLFQSLLWILPMVVGILYLLFFRTPPRPSPSPANPQTHREGTAPTSSTSSTSSTPATSPTPQISSTSSTQPGEKIIVIQCGDKNYTLLEVHHIKIVSPEGNRSLETLFIYKNRPYYSISQFKSEMCSGGGSLKGKR